jgi:hypothetical protein
MWYRSINSTSAKSALIPEPERADRLEGNEVTNVGKHGVPNRTAEQTGFQKENGPACQQGLEGRTGVDSNMLGQSWNVF